MACIGDKGLNLSGGQRARFALARFAIYLLCSFTIHRLECCVSDDFVCALSIGLFIMVQTCTFLMMY
jgi:ABC-type dipeptide/oligopeptide/nickel transport system ATPase subunit